MFWPLAGWKSSPFLFGADTGACCNSVSVTNTAFPLDNLQLELNPLGHYWGNFWDFRHYTNIFNMYRLPAHCLLNCSSSSCSKCVSALSFYHLANIDIDMVLCRIASEISLLKCKAAMWCGERRGRSRGPSGLLKTRRKRTTWQQTWPQQSEEGELAGEADAEP